MVTVCVCWKNICRSIDFGWYTFGIWISGTVEKLEYVCSYVFCLSAICSLYRPELDFVDVICSLFRPELDFDDDVILEISRKE